MEFVCPDKLIKMSVLGELPEGWDAIPPEKSSQNFGTQLLQSGIVCFAVPSVVDKTSLNYVINPLARQFNKVTWKVYPLKLDKRIAR